jgi:hypothetical protein
MSRGRIAIVSVLAVAVTGAVLGTAFARSGGGKEDRAPGTVWNVPGAKAGGEKGTQWAVLNADGSTARHSNHWISSADTHPPGGYGVAFKKSVQNCGYQATIGTVTPSGAPTQGNAFVAPYGYLTVIPNAVYIDTVNAAGSFADRPVYVAATC